MREPVAIEQMRFIQPYFSELVSKYVGRRVAGAASALAEEDLLPAQLGEGGPAGIEIAEHVQLRRRLEAQHLLELGRFPIQSRVQGRSCSRQDGQFLTGLIIRVPPTIASAITPAAIASQLPAAAKAPVAAQLHDDSASANVAIRDEV